MKVKRSPTPKLVIDVVDNGKDFESVRELLVQDAPFDCQADSMKDMQTVEDYANWMVGVGNTMAPDFSITKHCSAWDDETKTAVHFATFHATNAGDGGPVPPTNKTMDTDYVHCVQMNGEDKVTKMRNVWNDGFEWKQVGWAQATGARRESESPMVVMIYNTRHQR